MEKKYVLIKNYSLTIDNNNEQTIHDINFEVKEGHGFYNVTEGVIYYQNDDESDLFSYEEYEYECNISDFSVTDHLFKFKYISEQEYKDTQRVIIESNRLDF